MKPAQFSKTAAYIAVKFYGLTRTDPFRSWFDKGTIRFYEQLVRELPFPLNYYERILVNKSFRSLFTLLEERLLPGDLMHILLRKYYIGQMVSRYRDEGYRQLIVLGAGFDHLAVLQSQKGLPSFELDAPRMAEEKRKFIEAKGYQNPRLHLLKAFFTRDSLIHLFSTTDALDPDLPTIVVAEGFFDYLAPRNASEIMEDLHHFFNNRIGLACTLFALDELQPFHRFVFKSGVRLVGEKIRSDFSYRSFRHWLKDHYFNISEVKDGEQMNHEMLRPHSIQYPVLDGFYLFSAVSKG